MYEGCSKSFEPEHLPVSWLENRNLIQRRQHQTAMNVISIRHLLAGLRLFLAR